MSNVTSSSEGLSGPLVGNPGWASPRHGRTSLKALMSATTGVEPVEVDAGRLGARRWSGAGAPGAVKRKTAADRFSRALRRIAEWCRTHRHHAVKEQCPRVRTSEGAGRPGRALCLKLKGHFGYYGITGNSAALDDFRYHVKRVWQKWLSRHSQTAHIAWERFALLPGALSPDVGPALTRRGAEIPSASGAPGPPLARHVAKPCHEEPDASIAHVRIRGGRGRATALGYPTVPSSGILDGPIEQTYPPGAVGGCGPVSSTTVAQTAGDRDDAIPGSRERGP
jgi:hypothetical protein